MRIAPNHPRLRLVAMACWAFGTWALLQAALLSQGPAGHVLNAALLILGVLGLALGITFWLLGNDRRAGITFDAKGLMLNLGASASFVSWDNIAAVGVSRRRQTLLALGSVRQIGIRLHSPDDYLQSYEARLPAGRGPLAWMVQQIGRLLCRGTADNPAMQPNLALSRQRTGYDLLIPEALLGGRADSFVELIEAYRVSPPQRRELQLKSAWTL